MKMRANIYYADYKRQMGKRLANIHKDDRKVAKAWLDERLTNGTTHRRAGKLMTDLRQYVERFLKKPMTKATLDDFKKARMKLLENKELSEWTKHDYLHIARMFYRYIKKQPHPEGEEYLKPVPPKNMKRDTTQIYSPEDIEKLIDSALQVRFKAYISSSWEAGLRIEEALGLVVREVVKEPEGYRLHVDGKTGKRQPLIMDSKGWLGKRMDEIQSWPQDYFIFSKEGKSPPSYESYWKMLRETGARARITKPIRAHMLRHSRITLYANNGWTESDLDVYFGWVQGSDMARTYIHRDARTVDKRVLQEDNKALESVSSRQLQDAIMDIMKHKTEFKKMIVEMMEDGK